MSQEVNLRKVSIIFELILFLMFVLVTILLFSRLNEDYYISKAGEENLHYDYENLEDIKWQNKAYLKKIKEEYGINIYYGDNTQSVVEKIEATIQADEFIVNNNLKMLYNSLKKYPIDLFTMSKSKKYPINIILVDSFLNDNLALASRNNLNEFRIYLSNKSKFERAFHHEMFHVLEFYMSDTHKYLFASWYTLNPNGFKYVTNIEDLNNDYVYVSGLFNKKIKNGIANDDYLKEENDINVTNVDYVLCGDNPYFVTKYSKVSEKEDRAEIFAEIMIQEKKEPYLVDGQNIKKKALVIKETIENNITINEFYYNKFL